MCQPRNNQRQTRASTALSAWSDWSECVSSSAMMIKEAQSSFSSSPFFFFLSKAQPASHSGAKSFHCESTHVRLGGGRARATFTQASCEIQTLFCSAPTAQVLLTSTAAELNASQYSWQRLNKCHVSWVVPSNATPRRAACARSVENYSSDRDRDQRKSPGPAAVLRQWAPLLWLHSNILHKLTKQINSAFSLYKQYAFISLCN